MIEKILKYIGRAFELRSKSKRESKGQGRADFFLGVGVMKIMDSIACFHIIQKNNNHSLEPTFRYRKQQQNVG